MRIKSFVPVGVLVSVFGLFGIRSVWAQADVQTEAQVQTQAPPVMPTPFAPNIVFTPRLEARAWSGLRTPLLSYWGVTAAEAITATATTRTWTPDRALSLGALVGFAGLNTYLWRQVADAGHPRLAKVVLWTLTGLNGSAAIYVAGYEHRQ